MQTPAKPQQTLAELLSVLEATVHDGVRERAHAIELYQEILRCLASEEADRYRIERQVRILIAGLDRSQAETGLVGLDPSKGSNEPKHPYYVWFCTNRKVEVEVEKWKEKLITKISDERVYKITAGCAHLNEKWEISSTFLKDEEQFLAEIKSDKVLLYLSGAQASFEQAVKNAHQFQMNLNINHTAIFSWPSIEGDSLANAEVRIEASEQAITDFLVKIAEHCGPGKVHIIAHRLGNRGLIRALQRIAADPKKREKVKFGQIFLVTPDVDRQLFQGQAPLWLGKNLAKGVRLYVSTKDRTIIASQEKQEAPRAGYYTTEGIKIDPIKLDYLDPVCLPNLDFTVNGVHTSAAEYKLLVEHMGRCISGE